MTNIIIPNYIFCILILCILILGASLQRDLRDKSTKQFILLICIAILLIFVNIIAEALEGKSKYTTVLNAVNLFAYISVDLLMCQFARYLTSLLVDRPERNIKWIPLIYIASAIRVAVIITLFVSGKLFSIVDGKYVEGELDFIPYVMTGFILMIPLSIIAINRNCFTLRQYIVISMYVIFPIVPVLIESLTGIYTLTPMAITLSLLMVYVLIQDDNIENAKLKQSILEEVSSTDQLTNVNNRRAYYNTIQKIASKDNVGVAFCDINGLKYTNDHFGHASGDILIKKFANILTNTFRDEDVYRISGDEFVIIIPNISEEMFNARLEALKKSIDNNDNIASFGHSYGSGSRLEHLINEAESLMYENKQKYYKEKGKTERR